MEHRYASPYGMPGDQLWVREAWRACAEANATKPRDLDFAHRIWYEADAPHQPGAGKLRPGMFMPRWASRFDLEVTGVRVERLQDLSEADARAEGVTPHEVRQMWLCGASAERRAEIYRRAAVRSYRELWEQLNGAGSWVKNPWVWVV